MNSSLIYLVASACTLSPHIIVSNSESGSAVTIRGNAAQAIYEHLTHPLVQVKQRWLVEKKTGYGVECTRRYRWGSDQYSCVEILADGKTVVNFKFDPVAKDESKLLFLRMQGAEQQKLFESMSSEINPENLPDGSIENKKISSHLTCTQRIDTAQNSTYVCEQILSPAGYAWGTGTAPMIGAGTVPLYVDAE